MSIKETIGNLRESVLDDPSCTEYRRKLVLETTDQLIAKTEQAEKLAEALEVVTIFFGSGPFTKQEWDRWYALTKNGENPALNIAPCTEVVKRICSEALLRYRSETP